MIRTKSPADTRPFQSKSKLMSQEALEARYGRIGIQEVAEALLHLRPQADRQAVAA